jgi:hypothetical protein
MLITTEYFTELDKKVKKRHKARSGRMFLIFYGFGFSREEYKAFTKEARYNYKTAKARRL